MWVYNWKVKEKILLNVIRNSTELVQEVIALQTATSANPVSGGGDVEGSKQWLFTWFNIDDERGFEQLSTGETTIRLRGTENRSLNLLN